MTINTELLIAAPMLQDYLVDKDTGLPLASGIITLYRDNARSFFKNWYYQTGSPGAYSYIALDNPLTLSSSGTIQDPNGNDVIPFYYPYSEDDENQADPYYITVYSVDENGAPSVLQFTRENFPFNPSGQNPTATNPTWRNYIINNVYWRNIGDQNLTNVTEMIIAPSQHAGFTNGDIRFIKNITGGADALSFAAMTNVLPTGQTQNGAITPEYMLSMECTGEEDGETVKCIQYPISLHVKTLNSVQGTIIFYGQNVSGNSNNYVDLYFYQYLGTGALSQPDPILIQRVTLNNEFQEFQIPFTTPSSDGLSLGSGGDDALFLRVQYPLSLTFNINHTKPQIYFSSDVPSNDFDTYDQIEAIVESARTGDYRMSLNSFQPFGWVSANDGTIGSASSGATTRANVDTWPLYNLLWGSVNNTFAPVSGGRGGSAIADFSANKAIGLTKALGRVVMGLPTSSTFSYNHTTSILTVADTTFFYIGSPVLLTNSGGALPDAFTAGTVYYAIPVNSTTMKLATTYANAIAGTAAAGGSTDGSGTNTISFALGGSFGQSTHTLTVAEMPSHTHTDPNNYALWNDAAGTVASGGDVSLHRVSLSLSNTGGSSAHNIVQPSSYMNVYFKL